MDESPPVHPRAGATTEVEVVRVEGGRAERRADAVAVEEPLEVRVDGETVAVTMRTPGADADLALGFLFAEGMIDGAGDVGSAAHCGRPGEEGYGNVDRRALRRRPPDRRRSACWRGAAGPPPRPPAGSAAGGASTGCWRAAPRWATPRRSPADGDPALHGEALAGCSRSSARTGGLHAAAAFGEAAARCSPRRRTWGATTPWTRWWGRCCAAGWPGAPGPPGPALLAVSGRTSFEIVQKAAAARRPGGGRGVGPEFARGRAGPGGRDRAGAASPGATG